jgi:hypothetical protein
MTDYEWLDAREFADWLEARLGEEGMAQLRTWARWDRAYRRWDAEARTISIYTIDELFRDIGLDLWEIPDSIYSKEGPHVGRAQGTKYPPELREKVAQEYRKHGNAPKIAKRYGVSARSVWNWSRDRSAA